MRYISLMVLLAMLVGCGGTGSPASDPDDTVERYLTAKVAGEREQVQQLLCASMEADLDREALSFAGVEATIENMECRRDGESNTVTCAGEIKAVYGAETTSFPLGKYNVVLEDGQWKWRGATR